ncbi:MAG: hypothetical protein DHS20C11_37740 [Lysobacteraceae bacterium]|nr:MAG: hypothetical protein DHS20C11_37740 [Xanthomonadaceae bacterium]
MKRIKSECPKAFDPAERPAMEGRAGGGKRANVAPWMAAPHTTIKTIQPELYNGPGLRSKQTFKAL